jgi:hypothetical protein
MIKDMPLPADRFKIHAFLPPDLMWVAWISPLDALRQRLTENA